MRADVSRDFGREWDNRRVSDHAAYVQSGIGVHVRRDERGTHFGAGTTFNGYQRVRVICADQGSESVEAPNRGNKAQKHRALGPFHISLYYYYTTTLLHYYI